MVNEFEEMYNKDDFNEQPVNSDATVNAQPDNETHETNDLISSGNKGELYDFSKAPKSSKGPERILMDGKTVVIDKIEMVVPSIDTPWKISKSGKVKYKTCIFSVFYDTDGQKEYYSGVKVFERKEGPKPYSEPTIQNHGTTQISQLKDVYAEFKGKTVEEVSLHEFYAFLNSKPKAVLEVREFKFYDDKTKQEVITKKNIIAKFV